MFGTPTDSHVQTTDMLRSESISTAMSMLYRSYCYARQAKRDIWDFSIELADFRAANLFSFDLRWLIAQGFVAHAQDASRIGEPIRRFVPVKNLSIPERSCFVLTKKGIGLVSAIKSKQCSTNASSSANYQPLPSAQAYNNGSECTTSSLAPIWDPVVRELRLNSLLVKSYRRPAPNQERILNAFQEDDWPARIDDPLPPASELDCQRRLSATIN